MRTLHSSHTTKAIRKRERLCTAAALFALDFIFSMSLMNIFLDRDVLRMSTMSRQVISSVLSPNESLSESLTVLENESKSLIFQHYQVLKNVFEFSHQKLKLYFNETFLVTLSTTVKAFWIKYDDVMMLQMSISVDWWLFLLLFQVWWTRFDYKMDGYQISFQFQVGLVRDRVTVDSASLNLKSIKSKACDFICEKFPQNGLTRLDERILLFKHDYKSTNILQVSVWKSTFLMILLTKLKVYLYTSSLFVRICIWWWFCAKVNIDTSLGGRASVKVLYNFFCSKQKSKLESSFLEVKKTARMRRKPQNSKHPSSFTNFTNTLAECLKICQMLTNLTFSVVIKDCAQVCHTWFSIEVVEVQLLKSVFFEGVLSNFVLSLLSLRSFEGKAFFCCHINYDSSLVSRGSRSTF